MTDLIKIEKQSIIQNKSNGRGGARPGAGRKKGSVNVLTGEMKDVIFEAFNNVGGVKYLEKVANEDMKTFCGLLGKIVPLTLSGDKDNPLVPDRVVVEIKQPS